MSAVTQPVIEVVAGHPSGLPVVIGVPFPQGAVTDLHAVSLRMPDGQPCPVAVRPLATWADGSLRWGLLTFQAIGAGRYQVELQASPAGSATTPHPVTLFRQDNRMILDNGLVRVVLDAEGPGPIREIAARGRTYLARPEDLRFVVDDHSTRHEIAPRTLEILEESPLRVRARIGGAHYSADGERLLHYRLDVELCANWQTMRMDYQFFNLEPGCEELPITRLAMEWAIDLGAHTERHFLQSLHGLTYEPREVFNSEPVAIVSDDTCGPAHVADPAMLLDDVQYPSHLRPPLINTADWLGVGDGQRSVYLRMQDFLELRPKRLSSVEASLYLEFWPAADEVLLLPQGRSRRQVMTVAFIDDGWSTPTEIEQLLAAPLWEGRAIVAPEWLRACGEFEMDRLMAPAANVRFEKYLAKLVTLNTPQDFFDLGDTIDSGYSRTYLPIPNNIPLKSGAPALPRVYLASAHNPFAEWALPQLYEPVWTNNEYDSIYALCSEIMRAGKPGLWTLARWFVRHAVEVDFVHYHDDRQQHRGSPQHSCRHNRSGSVLSHFWTQGLLQYYCMTGDLDVLEVAMALGDKIIEDLATPELRTGFLTFTRELGWPALALSHLYDITGKTRYRVQLEEILDYLMRYDRGPWPVADRPSELERGIAWGLTFWYCMFEGVNLFVRRTDNPEIKAWLEEFLRSIVAALEDLHREGKLVGIPTNMVMAIGYEMTGDPRFLRVGMTCLDEFIDSPWWTTPPPETKPMAIIYRGLVRFLHHAHQAGLLQRLEYPEMRESAAVQE